MEKLVLSLRLFKMLPQEIRWSFYSNTYGLNVQLNVDSKENCFDIRPNEGNVSFCAKLPENHLSSAWKREGRQTMKLGKFIKFMVKKAIEVNPSLEIESFTDSVIEDIVNDIKSANDQNIKFEIHDTDFAYDSDNHYDSNGTLGNSCMNNDLSYVRFYQKYCKEFKGVLCAVKHDKIVGRALLWDFSGKKVIDRQYYHEDYLVDKFREYAFQNGYFIRKNNSNGYCSDFLISEDSSKCLIFTVNLSESLESIDETPYVDTFRYIQSEYELSNESGYGLGELTETDGSNPYQSGNYSQYNGCYIDSDDSYYSEYHSDFFYSNQVCWVASMDDHVLEAECVEIDGDYFMRNDEDVAYSGRERRYFLISSDEYIYVESIDDYALIEDAIYSDYEGEYILLEDATEFNDEWYLTEDCVDVDGVMIPKHLCELVDGNYKLTEEAA